MSIILIIVDLDIHMSTRYPYCYVLELVSTNHNESDKNRRKINRVGSCTYYGLNYLYLIASTIESLP